MPETSGDKAKKFKIAQELFQELLDGNRNLPQAVKKELEEDVRICKEKLQNAHRAYNIWTINGKGEAPESTVDEYQQDKELFVDGDESLVYIKGKPVSQLQKSDQGYRILIHLMENRGSAKPKNVFRITYPEKRQPKTRARIIKELATPMSRLRKVLEEYGLKLNRVKVHGYSLDESIDFALARKKR